MTWAYALFLSGLMLIFIVVYYGEDEFREEIINKFGMNDWIAPKLWEFMIKFVFDRMYAEFRIAFVE